MGNYPSGSPMNETGW